MKKYTSTKNHCLACTKIVSRYNDLYNISLERWPQIWQLEIVWVFFFAAATAAAVAVVAATSSTLDILANKRNSS